MSQTIDARDAWVEQVFGIQIGAPGANGGDASEDVSGEEAPGQSWEQAVASWQDASEDVDAQISQLQAALKQSDFSFLHKIADAGLNGITANHKVPVLAAIQDVNRASGNGRQKAAKKARSSVDAFIAHLNGDARVQACDDNPFGVSVGIKSTLVPALQKLGAALDAMA